MKVCAGCRDTKPLSEFGTNLSVADGYQRKCKPCRAEEMKEWHRRQRAKRSRLCAMCGETKPVGQFVTYQDQCRVCRSKQKLCCRCRQIQPLDAFPPNGRPPDGRAGECRTCSNAARRHARSVTPERERLRDVSPQRRARRNARLRARLATDPEYRERLNAHRRRRHILRQAGCSIEELGAACGWTCYLCGEDMDASERLDVDHVIPVSRGGRSGPPNVALTHMTCNRRKSDLDPTKLKWIHPGAAARIAEAIGA